MNCEENLKQWRLWRKQKEIGENVERLREASVTALCEMEKYQSACVAKNKLDISRYIAILAKSVRHELEKAGVDNNSRVLFVGAGAFPLSALTIARETGGEVWGLDIDSEAVALARKVAEVTGTEANVRFSDEALKESAFARRATHVIIASLVKNKQEVLADLQDAITADAKVILRYGNGLKSIFNYPLDKPLTAEWVQTDISQNNNIYDALLLQKAKPRA